MKCDECRILLEDHFEGVLDATQARLVRAHLESCPACTAEYEVLKNEQQVYAHYKRDVEVTPALWASIERRINAEVEPGGNRQEVQPRGSLLGRLFGPLSGLRLSPALVAAMVALAIGATVVVTKYFERQPAPAPPIAQNPPPASEGDNAASAGSTSNDPGSKSPGSTANDKVITEPPGGAQTYGTTASNTGPRRSLSPRKLTPADLIRDAENKYLSAIAMLTRDAKRREATLDPAARTRFETALAIIDNTIEETRQAVRQNPNDPIALQYLLTAYGKKVEALREMSRE